MSASAALDSPDSYEIGWVMSCHDHFYAAGKDTYANSGAKMGLEDTTNGAVPNSSDYKDSVSHTFASAQFDIIMEWDMTNYAPDGAGEGAMWLDYRDPVDGLGWYSDQNGGQMFPDAAGTPVGIRHGNWAAGETGIL